MRIVAALVVAFLVANVVKGWHMAWTIRDAKRERAIVDRIDQA